MIKHSCSRKGVFYSPVRITSGIGKLLLSRKDMDGKFI